jgi:hypothetical protein
MSQTAEVRRQRVVRLLLTHSNESIATITGYNVNTVRNIRFLYGGDACLYMSEPAVPHWPCIRLTKAMWPKCGHGENCCNGKICGAALNAC